MNKKCNCKKCRIIRARRDLINALCIFKSSFISKPLGGEEVVKIPAIFEINTETDTINVKKWNIKRIPSLKIIFIPKMSDKTPKPKTVESEAVDHMTEAFKLLLGAPKSRECSIAITQLETAIMWANKDRTVKGELSPTKTHVQQ